MNLSTDQIDEIKRGEPALSDIEELLCSRQWERADWASRFYLCSLTDEPQRGHLSPHDVATVPFDIWSGLDNAWSTHSNGHFGFFSQLQLWRKLEAPLQVRCMLDMTREERMSLGGYESMFGLRVGWPISADRSWPGVTTEGNIVPRALPYALYMCSYGAGLTGTMAAAVFHLFDQSKTHEKTRELPAESIPDLEVYEREDLDGTEEARRRIATIFETESDHPQTRDLLARGRDFCVRWATLAEAERPTQMDVDGLLVSLSETADPSLYWLELRYHFKAWARRRGFADFDV